MSICEAESLSVGSWTLQSDQPYSYSSYTTQVNSCSAYTYALFMAYDSQDHSETSRLRPQTPVALETHKLIN